METKKEKQSNWKQMAEGIVGKVFEHAGENISLRVQKFIGKFKRRVAGSLLLAVGITFFLNSIAIYINVMTQDLFPWLGYSAVGLVTIFVGYVMIKE
jgi:uncharacterized membrane protein